MDKFAWVIIIPGAALTLMVVGGVVLELWLRRKRGR
jgi:ABC-type dipeptide/oligopeptide/nickel transport system permease subunit